MLLVATAYRKADPSGYMPDATRSERCAGEVVGAPYISGLARNTGSAGVVRDNRPQALGDRPGALGWRRGSVVRRKPGNAGGGKGRVQDAIVVKGLAIADVLSTPINVQELQMALHSEA